MSIIKVTVEKMTVPTYESASYEELPMFAWARNHQGTSGNPYPNRIVNKVRRDKKTGVPYTAIRLENDYLDITILPELGGRIFGAVDKSNGRDFFYRQQVIKPALIGMFGLWISGGVEFNWPMHHRPGTFVPIDFYVEHKESGAVTVWLSEHNPIDRMKGMVGITLYPDRAVLETRAKIFNRTSLPRSFLWWENAAIAANENVQVFFPPDVTYVTHHYKRAVGAYPVMDGFYMGLDNRGGVDIRFHKNSRLGTSYFSGISKYDFFGGYDHGAKAGVLHHASHYTSPGKKMFTWGYSNLSKDWERALTDTDGPYLELMASSYSDNQPDFSWIEPYETKEFVQTWYPYKDLGEVKAANERAAFTYKTEGGKLSLGIYAAENLPRSALEISRPGKAPLRKNLYLEAMNPLWEEFPWEGSAEGWTIKLLSESGETVLGYTVEKPEAFIPEPLPLYPGPESLDSAEDCFMTGLHVDQYHDPLVESEVYWKRGLELDPRHPGCLTSMGRYCIAHLRFVEAESYLRKAVKSLTRYNPNPRDTEAFYLLGLALIQQGKNKEALEILHKALWGVHWAVPSACTIAPVLSAQGDYAGALREITGLFDACGKNQKAREILITLLRKMGNVRSALVVAEDLLASDPLDLYAFNELRLMGEDSRAGDRVHYRLNETGIDLAADYASMGLWEDALDTLEWVLNQEGPTSMVLFCAGYAALMMDKQEKAKIYFDQAKKAPDSLRFPSLAFEKEALTAAAKFGVEGASLGLGMIAYGIERNTGEAVSLWQKALTVDSSSFQALRNLAVGLFRQDNKNKEVIELLQRASSGRPEDLQLYYEINLVSELQNLSFEKRLANWEKQKNYADKWDELFLQGVRLFSQMGQWQKALDMLKEHTFTPAEGGEAAIAAEYYFACQSLAYDAMRAARFSEALEHFEKLFKCPYGVWNDIMLCPYKYGQALCFQKMGKTREAEEALAWIVNLPLESRSFLPSFRYYLGMALSGLGKKEEAKKQFLDLKEEAEKELAAKEYGFFVSSASFSSFIREPADQRKIQYAALLAMACKGLGETEKATLAVETVLALDPLNQQVRFLEAL